MTMLQTDGPIADDSEGLWQAGSESFQMVFKRIFSTTGGGAGDITCVCCAVLGVGEGETNVRRAASKRAIIKGPRALRSRVLLYVRRSQRRPGAECFGTPPARRPTPRVFICLCCARVTPTPRRSLRHLRYSVTRIYKGFYDASTDSIQGHIEVWVLRV